MGLFKKIGSKVKQATKWVGNSVVGKSVNGVGKILAASNIPVLSTVGAVIDKAIPDVQKVAQMVDKATEAGFVDVAKVEETVINANPNIDSATLKQASQAIVKVLDQDTPVNVTIDDTRSITKISIFERVKNFFIGNKWALVAFPVGIYFLKKNSKKSNKKYR